MATTTPVGEAHEAEAWTEGAEIYRSVSTLAVTSLVLGILSQLAWIFPALTVIAAATVLVSWAARRRIRKYPNELTGGKLATIGLVGGIVALLGAPTFAVVYGNLQVPEGYEPVTFAELRPNPDEEAEGQIVSQRARELEHKQVFIRGYVHPAVGMLNDIRQFVLVPDIKTCCFGGQPNIYDMVEVTVIKGKGVSYGYRRRGIGGEFLLRDEPRSGPGGIQTGYFELRADHVQ